MNWVIADKKTDVRVYPLMRDRDVPPELEPYDIRESMTKPGAVTWFFGKRNEPHLLLAGVGEGGPPDLEKLRQAAGGAGRAVEKEAFATVGVSFAGLRTRDDDEERIAQWVTAWTEGWLLGTYQFDPYKSKKKEEPVREIAFLEKGTPLLEEAVERGKRRASRDDLQP